MHIAQRLLVRVYSVGSSTFLQFCVIDLAGVLSQLLSIDLAGVLSQLLSIS